jgi:hypothetical protein
LQEGRRGLSSQAAAAAAAPKPLGAGKVELEQGNNLAFDHVQMYVSSLRPLAEYQALEANMAALGAGITSAVDAPEERRALAERWAAVAGAPEAPFTPFGQDVVEQMIVGAGWRVVASATGATTETVLVRSADPRGVRFVVTAPRDPASLGACMPDHAVAEVMAKADAEIAAQTAESEKAIADIQAGATDAVKAVAKDTANEIIAAFGGKADAKAVTEAVTARMKG